MFYPEGFSDREMSSVTGFMKDDNDINKNFPYGFLYIVSSSQGVDGMADIGKLFMIRNTIMYLVVKLIHYIGHR